MVRRAACTSLDPLACLVNVFGLQAELDLFADSHVIHLAKPSVIIPADREAPVDR